MAKFTRIPEDTFQRLQINSGILCRNFTPTSGQVEENDMIGATTGGITFTAAPTFTDFGEDIDNCPKNSKELKRLNDYEIKASGTLLTMDTASAKMLMAAADIGTSDTTLVTPRRDLLPSDFSDLWIVGDYSDHNGGTNGGYIAVKLLNALSPGGFQMKTADRSKGQFSFEFTAHYSLSDQSKVPYELYIKAGTAEPSV